MFSPGGGRSFSAAFKKWPAAMLTVSMMQEVPRCFWSGINFAGHQGLNLPWRQLEEITENLLDEYVERSRCGACVGEAACTLLGRSPGKGPRRFDDM